ncbi:MAG: hypothetical protein KF803_05145 [Cyclobacteriaceae bacterium]|nr:hypothetical protein [Cyclobacteriaceae bacterium]
MKGVAVYILFLLSPYAFAQVVNDRIDNRIELHLDSVPVYSNTHKATVQWGCINKALTNSCLVYHNDQWFYFTPTDSRKQYLNITNQQCKNFKGVQVVVIEGNPCETQTYKLMHCTSFTDQNDAFIELGSLKPGTQYLVLIDGFLGDQCHFNIQLSKLPVGLSNQRASLDTLSLIADQTEERIVLHWQAHQQLLEELDHFEIFRQRSTDSKAEHLGNVEITTNALGRHTEAYVYNDNLSKPGTYVYRIVGVNKENSHRLLLDEKQVAFYPPGQHVVIEERIIQFPVAFSGAVEIVVADAVRGTTLFGFTLPEIRENIIPVDVSRYVASGKRFFRIKVVHLKSRNVFTQTYAWGEDGEWIVVPK